MGGRFDDCPTCGYLMADCGCFSGGPLPELVDLAERGKKPVLKLDPRVKAARIAEDIVARHVKRPSAYTALKVDITTAILKGLKP